MSQAENDAVVAGRPRWAARELISWLAAGLLLAGVWALMWAVFRAIDQIVGPEGVVQVAAPSVVTDVQVGNHGRPLPPGTVVYPDGTAEAQLVVSELPAGLRLLTGSVEALAGLGTFVAALLGRRILLSIAHGRPFDRRNPRRFVGVAVALLVGGVGASAMATVATQAVLGYVGIGGNPLTQPLYPPATPIPLDGLWWALIALAVAEAFRVGRRLAEETDGLV